MSADNDDEHGAEDTRHHETFDPTPTTELAADEPQSPMWLPALGAALFIGVGIWWMTGDDAPAAENRPATSATASTAPTPTGAPAVASGTAPKTAAPRRRPTPKGSASANANTEARRKRREAIQKLRKAKQGR